MDLATILSALPYVGPLLRASPAVASIVEHAIATLSDEDQATAKARLAELRAENDEGHARLQDKLGGE